MFIVWADYDGGVLVFEDGDDLVLLVDVLVAIEEVRRYPELLRGLVCEVPECY